MSSVYNQGSTLFLSDALVLTNLSEVDQTVRLLFSEHPSAQWQVNLDTLERLDTAGALFLHELSALANQHESSLQLGPLPEHLQSIFHFGEQYWESKGISKLRNWFLSVFIPYILHGILVFNLIFLNNLTDVNFILEKFTINELSENILYNGMLLTSFFYLISILSNSSIRIHFFNEILFFGLFYIISMNSTLLFSFAFYFAFFHSILSMNDQIKFVYGNVTYNNIKKYILFAFPYFILALIFLYILYKNFNIYSDQFLPIFFSFLAAITFPHVFVIEKMYNKMK